jgi:transposase
MKYEKVQLTDEQRKYLTDFISKGNRMARAIRRAKTLLLLDQDTLQQKHIAAQLGCSKDTVTLTIKRFQQCERDVEQALAEKPRPGQPPKVTAAIEAHITALACAQNGPDGYCRWTLRLIADNLVELGHTDSITHETVRQVLKKVNSSPGRKSSGALVR